VFPYPGVTPQAVHYGGGGLKEETKNHKEKEGFDFPLWVGWICLSTSSHHSHFFRQCSKHAHTHTTKILFFSLKH